MVNLCLFGVYSSIDIKQDKNKFYYKVLFLGNEEEISILYKHSLPKQLRQANANISYMEIESLGHNALDFNLVLYIGMKAGHFRGSSLQMNIISNDSGFDTLKDNSMIKQSEIIEIYRNPTIKEAMSHEIKAQKNVIESILTKYALQKHTEMLANTINISTTKADLHNNLTKKLGKTEGLKVYNAIRPEFSKIKLM